MADEKDRFGETMKLVERAKEDIYFAQHDRELIEKLKAQLQKADKQESQLHCPKCPGLLESHTFQGFALDRCPELRRDLDGSRRARRDNQNSYPRSAGALGRQIVG